MEWRFSDLPVPYPEAVVEMEARAAAIRETGAPEMVWLLEHPPVYTAGTSAEPKELLEGARFPVYETGRGGKYTYHGPGQRVGYVLLDLERRGADIRKYVHNLEEWIIRTLAHFNLCGERREGRIGIWIDRGAGREDKIAATGVRVRKWVTYHGIALNVDPELEHFRGIVPCGIMEANYGVTSLADLGVTATMADIDLALQKSFEDVFGD
ncbi:MAG: lipoyl(octanoyl) transferase LipB [Alphaproteobacteria bacterium]|nr:lipoyl(octanoyl) transferase LipB [Alphaproteobacteria bacterium]